MNWLWTTNTLPDIEYFTPHKYHRAQIPRFMDSLILTLSLGDSAAAAGAPGYRRAFRPLLVLSGAS